MMAYKKQARKKCVFQPDENKGEKGCICPTGCLIGISITSPSDDHIHVECSNCNCTYLPFVHGECYNKWEKDLLQVFHSDPGRASKWKHSLGKDFAERKLWDQGYSIIRKRCKCKCGGFLKRTIHDDKAKKVQEQPRKKLAASDIKKSSHQLPALNAFQRPNGSSVYSDGRHVVSVAQMGANFKKELEQNGQTNKLPIGMTLNHKKTKNKASRSRTSSVGFDSGSYISDSKSECTENATSIGFVIEEEKENYYEDDENAGEWETVNRHDRKPVKPLKGKKTQTVPKQNKTTISVAVEKWMKERQNITNGIGSSNISDSYQFDEEFCADDLNQELALIQTNKSVSVSISEESNIPAFNSPVSMQNSSLRLPASGPIIFPPKSASQQNLHIPESGSFQALLHSHPNMAKHMNVGDWLTFDGYEEEKTKLEYLFSVINYNN